MTKAELIEMVATKSGLSKADAEKAVNATLGAVEAGLISEGKVTFQGFGSFTVEERKARVGRNPRTGEEMKIAATNVVKFKPGKALKSAVV
jgi:DNA-binding protein HU-beta